VTSNLAEVIQGDGSILPKVTLGKEESAAFVRHTHRIIQDLLQPRPVIFWPDFSITIFIAYSAYGAYLTAADWSMRQAVTFVVSALAFYRAFVFTHEIAHRSQGSFLAFRFVWNLLCGVPVFMPSFLYGDHKSHHVSDSYGTGADAEYLLRADPKRAVSFLLLSIVYPVLGWLRFLLLTPLIIAIPQSDRFVWTYFSSLYIMNPEYRREYDATAHSITRWIQEIAACAWAWCIALALCLGTVPWHVALKTYFLFLFWIGLNQLRTLAAHRYNNSGQPRNYAKQVLDTNTFAKGIFLPELWAPLGMRYHALHHLMPSLPYHAMRKAHLRLMNQLPADSYYHQTLQPSLWHALKHAFVDSRIRSKAYLPVQF
jgi:fatty acid desaturase